MRIEEQIRGMRPDRSVLLSASAGSGKTYVLIGRMVHLLAAGIPPGRLAAITFTEKAAAQMKDKLYETLAGAAWHGKGAGELLGLGAEDAPYPLKATPEEIFSALTVRPDAMRVSTIHSFCLGLLRQFPLEAGLPPDFRVMDESEIPIRRERAVELCLEDADKDLPDEFRILTDSGYDLKTLKGLLVSAMDKRGVLGMLMVEMGGSDGLVSSLKDGLKSGLKNTAALDILADGRIRRTAQELLNMLRDNGFADEVCLSALEGLMEMDSLDGLRDVFPRLTGYFYNKDLTYKKNSPVATGALADALRAAFPGMKGKALREKAQEAAQRHDALYFSLRDWVTELAGLYDDFSAASALAAFLKLYGKAEEAYSRSNLREGIVDYDDLEIHAYRLLSGPNGMDILGRVESKVLHYLVDEFQDTGPIQWGILGRLNSETFAGQGAEGPDAPTLFAVGDKKQSIYRFRMADYRLVASLRRKMESGIPPGRRDFPELDYNFRSAPEILDVVDETFSALMKGEYRKAHPVRAGARGSVRLRVVPVSDEANALAEEIESALGLPILDDDKGEFRPAGYGDMAVLLRSRTGLMAYEEALKRRGIPFKVVGGVGFFYQDEVQALLGILNYLENPGDLLSLAAALKSPLFRLPDGELAPIYQSPEPMDALKEISPEAHGLISGWREKAGVMPLGRLTEDIVRDCAALFAFGLTGGPSAALNIEKLVGIARDFDRRGGVGLSEFTDWVRVYREKADMGAADVELPGFERFVSIMTVHAAKGLEFPVVFLPGAARGARKSMERFLFRRDEGGGPGMAVWTDALLGENPHYAWLAEDEKRERAEEAKRLLYVAMTRARDHLVVLAGGDPDTAKRPDGETWLGLLFEASPLSLFSGGPSKGEVPALYSYPDPPPKAMERPGKAASRPFEGLMPTEPVLDRLGPLPDEGGAMFISPSDLAGKLPEAAETDRPYPARLRGDIIHAALEGYGRRGEYSMKEAARTVPGFASLDKSSQDALLDDAGKALDSLLADEAIKGLISPGPGKYFELPLLLRRGDEVITGTADLVIINGGRATVVDYKTGLAGVSLDAVRAAYAGQLLAYCEAVKEAFKAGEAEAFIVLVDRKEIVRLHN